MLRVRGLGLRVRAFGKRIVTICALVGIMVCLIRLVVHCWCGDDDYCHCHYPYPYPYPDLEQPPPPPPPTATAATAAASTTTTTAATSDYFRNSGLLSETETPRDTHPKTLNPEP